VRLRVDLELGRHASENVSRIVCTATALTSGATGQLFGNHYLMGFPSGWQQNLNTLGEVQFGYMKKFFNSLSWFNLVPD